MSMHGEAPRADRAGSIDRVHPKHEDVWASGYGRDPQAQASVHEKTKLSDAAMAVGLMREALASIGDRSKQSSITPAELAELLLFYTGDSALPPSDSEEGSMVRGRLALYQPELQAAHLAGMKDWMRKKKNKEAIAAADELRTEWEAAIESGDEKAKDAVMAKAKTGALVPLGLPFSPTGAGANDLPDIPQALWLILERDENLAHKARNAFILGLKSASLKDNPVGKLCQTFSTFFMERNRSHIDAHDARMRNRLDNAALALLTYGILRPVVEQRANTRGEKSEHIGFHLNMPLLERHAEVFLAREQWKRLSKALASEQNPEQRSHIEQQLAELRESKDDADGFIKTLSTSRGISKPATIFETFGNRLYVPANELPVFDTPQPGDDSDGKSISGRSLDAALRVLGERRPIERIGHLNTHMEKRAGQYRHVLDTEVRFLGSLDESLRMFDVVNDESVMPLARNMLRELLEHLNNIDDVRQRCHAEMEREGISEKGRAERVDKFGPILELAENLKETYTERTNKMMRVVAPDLKGAPPQDTATEALQELASLNEQLEIYAKVFPLTIEVVDRNIKSLGRILGVIEKKPANVPRTTVDQLRQSIDDYRRIRAILAVGISE